MSVETSDYAGSRELVPSERESRRRRETPAPAEGTRTPPVEDQGLPPATLPPAGTGPGTVPRRWWTRGFWSTVNPFTVEGPKLPLVVLGLSAMLGGWSSQALGIAAPEIQATFGVSIAALTLIAAIQSSVFLVLGLPLGYLVDRVNRVRLLQIANFASPIGDMVSATARGYGTFLGGNALGTLASTPASGADMPLLADWYPTRARARVIGFLTVAGTLGGLIATPIVGLLLSQFGWRTTTAVFGVMGLVVACLSLLLKEPARGRMDRLELTGSEERMEEEPPPPGFVEALRGAWNIRTLRLQAIGGFVATFAAPLNILLGLILASKFALGPFERSMVMTLSALAAIPAVMIGSAVADRLLAVKPSTVVLLQAVVGAVASLVMVAQAFAPTLAVFVLLSVLGTVLPSVLGPIGFTITSMVVPARYRGVGMQVFTPFALVGALLGPALLTVAGQINLQQAFLFFAPFMVISSLIYLASAGSVTGDIRAARAAALAERDAAGIPDPGQGELLLVVRDLESTIDGATILASVDLDVRRGQVLALTGTNGAGKSTLLRAICGLQHSTNGAVFYGGVDVTHIPTSQLAEQGMLYLAGGQAVFPALTVQEHLDLAVGQAEQALTARGTDTSPGEPPAAATALRHFPELAERRSTRAGDLSGGEQQMLALAQCFLMRPELLLVDELSMGLAPAVVDRLLASVRELNAEGTTVILVEQSLNLAMRIADEIVYLDRGAVVFRGTPDELRDHPEVVRARFLGRSSATRVRARTRGSGATTGTTTAPVLVGTGLTLDYGGVRALDGVDLQVSAGEIVGLLGSNGAGKTTLFDVLSGYRLPDAGEVLLEGRDVTGLPADARARLGLARAFQSARLFRTLPVRETIAVALERQADKNVLAAATWWPGQRAAERRVDRRVDSLMDIFGLGDYADMPVGELSTGTRRALEVACQLAMEPTVLLLDEPSTGLAQAEVEGLGPALQRVVRDTGCGLVVIDHDLALLRSVSDRLVALERGRVIAQGPPEQVLDHPDVRRSYLHAAPETLHRSGADRIPTLPTQQEGQQP